MKTTFANEVLNKHIDLCNKVLCKHHRKEKPELFNFKVGDLVTTLHAYPRNIIGVVYGYIYSPFTNSYRVVLGVNADVEIGNVRPSNELEELTFNYYTDNFEPIEARYTVFFK